MKLIVAVTLALVAAAAAAPAEEKVVHLVRSSFEQQPEGAYIYAFETDDGTKKEETGELKTVTDEENKPQQVVTIRGTYSYVDPEGNPHSYVYYADESGFHIEGDDIPKAA